MDNNNNAEISFVTGHLIENFLAKIDWKTHWLCGTAFSRMLPYNIHKVRSCLSSQEISALAFYFSHQDSNILYEQLERDYGYSKDAFCALLTKANGINFRLTGLHRLCPDFFAQQETGNPDNSASNSKNKLEEGTSS